MAEGDPESRAPRPVGIRPGTDEDARVSAALHVAQIGSGFLASLGPAFLRRLYRRVVRSPDSFLVVAEGPDGVVGFVAGSTDVPALYRRFVVRDGVGATAVALPRLLRAWPRALETLRQGRQDGRGPGAGSNSRGRADAELLAVAVDAAWQGRGVGRRLVEAFVAEVSARGATSADVVVGAQNLRAVSLYRHYGFETEQDTEVHRGTRSLRMRWSAS